MHLLIVGWSNTGKILEYACLKTIYCCCLPVISFCYTVLHYLHFVRGGVLHTQACALILGFYLKKTHRGKENLMLLGHNQIKLEVINCEVLLKDYEHQSESETATSDAFFFFSLIIMNIKINQKA